MTKEVSYRFYNIIIIINAIICMVLEHLDILAYATLPISTVLFAIFIIYNMVIFIIELFIIKKKANEIRAILSIFFGILETVFYN